MKRITFILFPLALLAALSCDPVMAQQQEITRPFYLALTGSMGLAGGQTTNPAYSGLFISAGRMSGGNMSLGGGIGIDSYGVNDGLLSIPLFAEARWLPRSRQQRGWFLSGRLGYSFFKGTDPVVSEARGGLMLHPATGFIWRAGKRLGITTEVGYRFQWAADERQLRFRDGVLNRKVNYRRLAFSLGLLF